MKAIKKILIVFWSIFSLVIFNTPQAAPISLKANFHLLGEVNVFNFLRFGGLGVQVSLDGNTLAEGTVDYTVEQLPATTGLFSSLNFPNNGGVEVIDLDFSVPFDLEIGQKASLGVVMAAGAIRMAFDFSNDITFLNSILGDAPGQGLSLTSFTLADGSDLASSGLGIEFIANNTLLSAFVTDATNLPLDIATAPDKAEVTAGLAIASAELNPPLSLLNLSLSPEPNPLVFDFGCASIGTGPFDIVGGGFAQGESQCGDSTQNLNNIRLISNSEVPPVPVPVPAAAVWLLGSGLIGLVGLRKKASKLSTLSA